ncbi:MAG: hypothetical protein IJM75_01350 [Ruminococcus sp.]|nr:hypothetical protein [Ruminococcus sp.]
MKTLNALLTNTAKRIIAGVMAIAMMPGVLSYELIYAASTPTDITDEVMGDQQPTEDELEGITVWKDGKMQKLEAKTGEEWTDNDVSGGDSATVNALSVDEYTADQVAIDVKESENLYSLTAATGISPGTSVEYFAIRYTVGTGDNAVQQTKYIFPKIHTLSATDEYIKQQKATVTSKVWTHTTFSGYYSPGARLMVTQKTGTYATSNEEELEEARKAFYANLTSNGKYTGQITKEERKYKEVTTEVSLAADSTVTQRHNYLAEMNYKINENTLTNNALSAWGVDEFLFKTDAPITSVTGVEVFMSNGKWTVQGLSVSKVKKIGGYAEYGYYSGKYFLSLEKEIICELAKKKKGTLTLSANGDTLINVGGDDSIYFALNTPTEKTTTSTGFKDLYTFRMDFADTLDGGLESLLRNDSTISAPDAGSIVEDLAIEIEYKDINGWTRNVTMPVLTSVLGQYKERGTAVRTIGLAQRGDTLAFTACLPDFASIVSTKLYVAQAARDVLKTNCGLDYINESKLDNSLVAALDKDRISLSGLSIYKGTCRMSNTQDGKMGDTTLKSYNYAFSFSSSEPSFYYTTTQSTGYIVNAKTSDSFSLSKYKSGSEDPIVASGYAGNFLIRLKTSNIKGSETTGTVRAKIHYQDTSGNVKTSAEYNVKKEVENFLGYWPSKFKTADNFGYTYGLSLGNVLEFPVNLPNAAAVTSVEVSLDDFTDEWQLASISVSVLDGIGKRRAYAQELKAGTDSSPYRFVRPMIKTTIPPFPIDVQLLFTPGEKYAINTGTGTVVTSEELDYNAVRYKMTYEQTALNYGFVKNRKTFDIDVKVADDPDASSINGDSGSTNQFYFQLMFKNGRSGFVLANQQLSADGFRAGQHEMFHISVNRDYGDLQSIRIIPEDISEDSDVFDKLNVEEITVTEQTGGAAGMEYVISNVGWIDIDYHDSSEEKSVLGREGRSIGSLAKKYPVTKKRSVIYLLCEITADPWAVNHYDFEASVSCTIDYIDTNNQPQSKSFDVAQKIYEYMKKTPRVYSAGYSGDSYAAAYTSMGTVTDASWMLRPCHTDRFMLPALADVKTLTSMTFNVVNRTKGTAYWVISGVSISRINSDSGTVTLTSDGEFVRNMEVESHCTMAAQEPITMTLPTGTLQKQKIKLTQKDITWNENKTWISAVERSPSTTDDTLNVYVYPTENSRNIDDYPLGIAVQYTVPGARVMQVKQNAMKTYGSGTEEAMYYYTGLSVAEMQNLNSLWLSCRSTKTVFEYAIVEQVRDDVVVSRYVVNFGGASAMLGLKAAPSSSNNMFNNHKQILSLSFGELTKESNLIPLNDENSNVNDIAVAIQYRSSLDHGENVYTSNYVYLGDTKLKKLSPGLVVDVPFNVPYVSEITGYKIGMFGDIKAEVRGAVAYNYVYSDRIYNEDTEEYETAGDQLEGTYSIDQRFEVAEGIDSKKVTKKGMLGEGAVAPLELNIKTAEAEGDQESGNNSTIAATIYYKNHNGSEVGYEITDLRNYIQADSENKKFVTGQTAQLKLMLPDCEEITAIEIKPSEGSWRIERIDGWLFGDKEINRVVNEEFTTDGLRLSLKTVVLKTYIYYGDKYKGLVTKHLMSGVVDGGIQIKGQVQVDGGYDLSVKMYVSEDNQPDMPEDSYAINNNKFIFNVPKVGDATVPQTYIITVTAKENVNTQDVIMVTVPVPEKKQEEEAPADTQNTEQTGDETASEDNTGQQTDDTSSTDDSGAAATDESSEGSDTESSAADDPSQNDEKQTTNDESTQDTSPMS